MTGASSENGRRRADDEAVEWVLRLREDPDGPEVRAGFERWLSAAPAHAHAWAETARAYDRTGDVRPAFSPPVRSAEMRPVLPLGPTPYERRGPMPRNGRSQRSLRPRRWIVAAALAACIALVVAPAIILRAQADYMTGSGELREVSFADGSVARLAPQSAIAVTYGANRRQVRLLRGEAWFKVRHDAARPFYVDAKGVTATDLGTEFDVRVGLKGVTTEVADGRVHVAYAGAAPPVSEQMSAGQMVYVAFDGAVARAVRPADQVAAWRNHQIVVRDRPASEVVEALRPWFAGAIVVRGDGLARQRVTGVYNTADPVEALRGLTQAYGGSITRATPWVLVVSSR